MFESLYKCCSLVFVCLVFTDMICLHLLHCFVVCSFQFLACSSCIDLLWVACTPCNSDGLIISASVWNSDTCWEWNVEFLALEFHGESVDLALHYCIVQGWLWLLYFVVGGHYCWLGVDWVLLGRVARSLRVWYGQETGPMASQLLSPILQISFPRRSSDGMALSPCS